MAGVTPRSFGRRKPPFGTPVDFAHPLARNLVLAYLCNEGAGKVLFNSAAWACNPPGPNMVAKGENVATSHAQIDSPTYITWTKSPLSGTALLYTSNVNELGVGVAGTNAVAFDTTSKPYSLQAWAVYVGGGQTFGSGVTSLWNRGVSFNSDAHLWIGVDPVSAHLKRFSGFDSAYTISTNRLYHIIYTFDAATSDTSGTEIFYVNGVNVGSRTGTVPASSTGTIQYFGSNTSSFFPWAGTLDWGAMWVGRALSASDVLWLYEEPFAMYTEPPVHRIKFLVTRPNIVYTRTRSDAIGIHDSVIRGPMTFFRQLSDALGIADSQSRLVAPYLRVVSDAVGIAEVFARLLPTVLRNITDAIGINDTQSDLTVRTTSTSDAIGISDTLLRGAGTWHRILTDSLGIFDYFAHIGGAWQRLISDALGISDVWILGAMKWWRHYIDKLGIADSFSLGAMTWKRRLTDSPAIHDAFSRGVPLSSRVYTEFVGIQDIPLFLNRIKRVITDALAASDSRVDTQIRKRLVKDTVAIGEKFTRLSNAKRVFTERVGIRDVPFRKMTPPRLSSESLGLSDSVSLMRLLGHQTPAADNIGITDTPLRKLTPLRQSADNIAVSDTFQRLVSPLVRFLSDALGVADAVTVLRLGTMAPRDTIGIADTVSSVRLIVRLLTDAIGINDLFLRQVQSFPFTPVDALGIADAFADMTQTFRLLSDGEAVGIMDYCVMITGVTWTVPVSDALGIADSVTSVQTTTSRMLTDALGVADAAGRMLPLLRMLSDVIGIADPTSSPQVGQFPGHPPFYLILAWNMPDPPEFGQELYLACGRDMAIYFLPLACPMNISGMNFRWQLRYPEGSAIVTVNKDTVQGNLFILDPVQGIIELDLWRSDTINLPVQTAPWYWELRRDDPGESSVVARGTFLIDQDIAD